jgi:predicted secreted hydrolase
MDRSATGTTAALPSPSSIELPRDFFAHPHVGGGELWYITSRLRSGERLFGSQAMLSTVGGDGLMASTCVVDLASGEKESDLNRFALAKVALATDHLELRAPTASLTGSFEQVASLRGQVGEASLIDLSLRPTAPILHNCGTGSFPLAGQTTWEFAAPALATSGTITLSGETFEVDGWSWLDRQWFDRFDEDTRQRNIFTWMGICLGNGDSLSLWDWTVADPDGRSWVTIAHPDGSHTVASVVPVGGEAAQSWTSESGNRYPRSWTVRIPRLDATLAVTSAPLHEILGGALYTGILDIKGSYQGSPILGYGFTDLVGWNTARQP